MNGDIRVGLFALCDIPAGKRMALFGVFAFVLQWPSSSLGIMGFFSLKLLIPVKCLGTLSFIGVEMILKVPVLAGVLW